MFGLRIGGLRVVGTCVQRNDNPYSAGSASGDAQLCSAKTSLTVQSGGFDHRDPSRCTLLEKVLLGIRKHERVRKQISLSSDRLSNLLLDPENIERVRVQRPRAWKYSGSLKMAAGMAKTFVSVHFRPWTGTMGFGSLVHVPFSKISDRGRKIGEGSSIRILILVPFEKERP